MPTGLVFFQSFRHYSHSCFMLYNHCTIITHTECVYVCVLMTTTINQITLDLKRPFTQFWAICNLRTTLTPLKAAMIASQNRLLFILPLKLPFLFCFCTTIRPNFGYTKWMKKKSAESKMPRKKCKTWANYIKHFTKSFLKWPIHIQFNSNLNEEKTHTQKQKECVLRDVVLFDVRPVQPKWSAIKKLI